MSRKRARDRAGFKLIELLEAVGLDLSKAPSFVTETLNRIAGLLDDLTKLENVLADAVAVTDGAAAAQSGRGSSPRCPGRDGWPSRGASS